MLILVHIPKTGGTSLYRAFHTVGADITRSHDSAAVLKASYSAGEWNAAFKATFIRNPWDRAVSLFYWWNYEVISGMSFKEWIRAGAEHHREYALELGFDPLDQLGYLVDEDGNDLVQFIGRYEQLAEHAVALGKHIHAVPAPLHRMQRSSRPDVPYQAMYDSETAEMLADRTRPFIERFGYTFD